MKPRDYQLTFAGAGSQPIQAAGKYVYVRSAPAGDVYVEIDGSSEVQRGSGEAVYDADGFKRLSIRSNVAQTVYVVVSDAAQDLTRNVVSVNASATVAPGNTFNNGGDVAIPAGGTNTLFAGDPNTLEVAVYNPPTNADPIRVGTTGVTAASGIPVYPGELRSFATTATLVAYCASAQTVSVAAVQQV